MSGVDRSAESDAACPTRPELGHNLAVTGACIACGVNACSAKWCEDEAVRCPACPRSDAEIEAAAIDAELRELHSFVLVETGHIPTCDAVIRLRYRIAKALAGRVASPGRGDVQ